MLVYSKEKSIKAHEDINRPYYNHSYDRYVRDAICGNCGKVIGEQVKYPDFHKEFRFDEEYEKEEYKFCPYCGEAFY